MAVAENWSQLVAAHHDSMVPAFRALRPGESFALQYMDHGTELMAIHETAPYGELDKQQAHHTLYTQNLLKRALSYDNYYIVEVPEDVITVEAVTLDAYERPHVLLPLYRNIGKLLHEAAARDVRPPMLGVSDLALKRDTGVLVYVPPLQFEVSDRRLTAYEEGMHASMVQRFGHLLAPQVIDALSLEVQRGATDDNTQ